MMYAFIAASTILGTPKTVETNLTNLEINIENELETDESVSTLIRICRINAQFALPNPGDCAPNSIPLEISSDCNARMVAELQVLNLHANPTIGDAYPLLPGMSPIYIRYGIKNGQQFTIGPIYELEFKGNYAQDVYGNNFEVFEIAENFSIDINDECSDGGSSNAHIPLTIGVLDNNFNLYPVDVYAGIGEAFYCGVFEETCHRCPTNACGGGYPPKYDVTICGDCNNCENYSADLENLDISVQDIAVVPNPFSDEVTIDVPVSIEIIYINILDMTGKRLIQKVTINDETITKMTLDTNQLPVGMYILQVQSGKSISSQHIMKTK